MDEPTIGVLLAGGRGSRLGGAKALATLAGRPLICYPLAALRAVVGAEVAIVAKPETRLPALPGVDVWREPAHPRHPLVGIVHALACAAGRPVLVCAADMPFVTASVLRELMSADPAGSTAVVAESAVQGLQPLLGCYQPAARALLAPAAAEGVAPVRRVVASLEPRLLRVSDEGVLFNINSPDDLAAAQARLGSDG
ncbi:MAG: molybdenum cofactor guanylyltransferase [Acidimicrobiales bacterium]